MFLLSFVLPLIFIVPLLGSPIPQNGENPGDKIVEWKTIGRCSPSPNSTTVEFSDNARHAEIEKVQCEITFETEDSLGNKNIKIKSIRYITWKDVVEFFFTLALYACVIIIIFVVVIGCGFTGSIYCYEMCRIYKFQIVRNQ